MIDRATGTVGRKWRYVIWIAVRHLLSRRGDGAGLSFMTIVSILGVTIGVSALIIVLSVMGGFEADLKRKMLAGRPHLEVLSAAHVTAGFSLVEHPVSQFEKLFPEAIGVEPFTQAEVVVKRRRLMQPITIFGIDPARKGLLWGFGRSVVEGSIEDVAKLHPFTVAPERRIKGKKVEPARTIMLPGIIIGDELAAQLGADIGDEVTVLSPQMNAGSLLSGGTLSREFIMVGKFRSELFNFDMRWAVTSLDEGRKFMPDYDEAFDDEQYVTGVALDVPNPMDVKQYEERIKPLHDLQSLSWQKVNSSLLFALKLEKFAMGSILMLIVLVAAFSISGTMMMMVFHKKAQISLFRSLGMSQKDIVRLFLTHGFAIGTVGILAGLALGLGVCAIIYYTHNIPLPAGVYLLKSLPVRFLPWDYVVICGCAWILIVVAAIYPALTAARQDPGLGLRYD